MQASHMYGMYLHVIVNHEVEPVQVKVADFALQLVFDSVNTVQHYLPDCTLHALTSLSQYSSMKRARCI